MIIIINKTKDISISAYKPKAPSNIYGKFDNKSNSLLIVWDYPGNLLGDISYAIYRNKSNKIEQQVNQIPYQIKPIPENEFIIQIQSLSLISSKYYPSPKSKEVVIDPQKLMGKPKQAINNKNASQPKVKKPKNEPKVIPKNEGNQLFNIVYIHESKRNERQISVKRNTSYEEFIGMIYNQFNIPNNPTREKLLMAIESTKENITSHHGHRN